MFVYRSRLLHRGEVWYEEEPGAEAVDWIYYRQRPRPKPRSRWRPFFTWLIDLRPPLAALRSAMDPRTARKIHEAQADDHLQWECCRPQRRTALAAVARSWNEFADARHSARLEVDWLAPMIAVQRLEVITVRDATGQPLVTQLTYRPLERARQLIAVSHFPGAADPALRRRVNRANCFGHWRNFAHLQQEGVRYFDFGGWYPGTTDIERLGMNAFKQSFGGEVRRDFDGERSRSLRGWVALNLVRWLRQDRERHPPAPAAVEPTPHATSELPGHVSPAV